MGSNMGNRFEYLQRAVDAVFTEIGAIHKISSVYETPALGFDGDAFLNCVLWVRTTLTAKQTLKAIQKIEGKLGRNRAATLQTYIPRTIDIDILLYNDEAFAEKNLQVPHPRMQDRRFVLQPLAEVNGQLRHPVLKDNVIKLLSKTKDESQIAKQSKWLRNPKQDYDISRLNYIAIEGNIGAGKTSLATKLATDFNAKLILERFKDNPFLPKFYEDQQRYAFPLEMSFLADRYQQLLEDITQFDLFKDCVVADYDAYKSLIFAKVTLAEEEYNLYKKLFHLMHKELPKPDVYVYLYQNTERLLENIQKRGRKYEKGIAPEYLQKINEGYLQFIKTQPKEKVKIIDVSEKDFVKNRKDYLGVLQQILE
ncbi:2-amino-4-hydroxy-6-hydroxymethyldihydropteridine diphosphokinase [Marinirhabdus gelatinilytica]|uniref:2-amino-4-hydroxy-6- hydroxymethyldihydropteridine diphosphokinase n=1 Tax=Marinirhabdus gelatinilytica TaxID=1703343 RepID=UPI002937076F|nr:2-amino-4-hydroxy-6-hydroxymethyldihydropteridine diphosphokinase [Marinirhabdus gelatinilytica]